MNEYFELARNTGVVDVVPQYGTNSGKVIVWLGPGLSYTFLSYGAINAYWSGNILVIIMKGGTVRSYSDMSTYNIIK